MALDQSIGHAMCFAFAWHCIFFSLLHVAMLNKVHENISYMKNNSINGTVNFFLGLRVYNAHITLEKHSQNSHNQFSHQRSMNTQINTSLKSLQPIILSLRPPLPLDLHRPLQLLPHPQAFPSPSSAWLPSPSMKISPRTKWKYTSTSPLPKTS